MNCAISYFSLSRFIEYKESHFSIKSGKKTKQMEYGFVRQNNLNLRQFLSIVQIFLAYISLFQNRSALNILLPLFLHFLVVLANFHYFCVLST